MKWQLQMQRRPATHSGVLRPAVMPDYFEGVWRDYPMPKRATLSDNVSLNPKTPDGRFTVGGIHYIAVGEEIFREDMMPMDTLEEAMERWGAFPKWNEMQYDFRLVEKDTGEVIPLFLL